MIYCCTGIIQYYVRLAPSSYRSKVHRTRYIVPRTRYKVQGTRYAIIYDRIVNHADTWYLVHLFLYQCALYQKVQFCTTVPYVNMY